jgi:hypothetical protein
MFLKDKYLRLGLPFLLYTLIIGPLLIMFTSSVGVFPHRDPLYFPSAGEQLAVQS